MTVKEFKLPDLGEGLTDAEIAHWLVAVGDVVEIDQPVVEVVTAKASVELPCPYGGTVTALHHAEGEVADVGSALLSIEEASVESPGEAAGGVVASAIGGPVAATAEVVAPSGGSSGGSSGSVLVGYGTRPERRRHHHRAPSDAAFDSAATAVTGAALDGVADAPSGSGVRPRPAVLSPVVRRLARELGVDLASIQGSGPDGVIVRADVERARTPASVATSAASAAASPSIGPVERIPIRGLHRQMAERLSRSRREIPEATVWVDVDATGLAQARDAIDAANPGRAVGVGVTSLLARICVLGLERFPILNSKIEGDEIVVSRAVNLGFAAQTERGLLVPVARNAEQLTLLELDAEIRRLAAAARQGTLTTAEVTGGSFTVNNYGVFGVDGSAAIINHPEVAIVGIGRIMERPWVVEGTVRARPVTELTLAFDHRVCDGGTAGGFLRFVADCVEQPLRLLGTA
jgi:pyruvate dehydrogenase E2 component (dihydrolipoamide acetyltransferase)